MTAGGPVRWAVVLAGGLAVLASSGCGGVNRRFVIESNVPNAQVYVDNKPIGAAPAHASFEYYGYYNITLVHPDYHTENKRVHVVAPWYAYPPFDFLAEVVWPFRVEDVRRYYFELTPARHTDTGELIMKADALRDRGWNLPPAPHPAAPKTSSSALPPEPVAVPAPTPLPAPTPVPPSRSSPYLPSVTPTGYTTGGTSLR